MREKMLDLMKNEGLKPSQLAEMLEINPAGISHILAGRNKPGFDLLQKILRRFPQINPDWLLLDSGPMYRADRAGGINPTAVIDNKIKNDSSDGSASRRANGLFPTDIFSSAQGAEANPNAPRNSGAQTMQQTISREMDGSSAEVSSRGQSASAVARIVIFYDDQTFETYAPTKR